MTCSFTYSATTYTYYVDRISITPVVQGDQRRLISGDMDSDFQDIEFNITIQGVFEQSGASTKPANDLWLDALGGASISFKSDTTDSTAYIIVPDYGHKPVFVQTTKGTHTETVELRFISLSVYQEDNAVVTGVADMRPHYGA